jgi:hypothetical protein
VRIPKTLLGLLLIAAGVAGIGLGVLEWVDPHAYGRVTKQAWEYLDIRAIERLWRSLIGRLA